ncbi:MAG: ATP-binding cassette domain-containing protein [Thermoanaerobaculia bacterium]
MSFLFGVLIDALPLIPLVIALVWTLRFQKVVDLSLASSFSIGGGVCAAVIVSGQPLWLAMGCGLSVGLVCGILTGTSIELFKLDPLIASLINLFLIYAISLRITEGTIRLPNSRNPVYGLRGLLHAPWEQLPELLAYSLIALGVIWVSRFVLDSEWGCAFRALEDSRGGTQFLETLGIRPSRLRIAGFGAAGFLAASSGIVVLLRDGQTTSSLGLDSLIEVVPAYLLGVTLFERRPILRVSESSPGVLKKSLVRFLGLRNSSVVIAASIGVVVFFGIINAIFRATNSEWLPRVILSISLFLLLGFKPFLDERRSRRRQEQATVVLNESGVLKIIDVSVGFPTVNGARVVLKNANLTCVPGEAVLLRGANGVGKTSFLRALSGSIDCEGRFEIPSSNYASQSGVGMLRQQLVAYVAQNLEEGTSETISVEEHVVLARLGRGISALKSWKKSTARVIDEKRFPQMSKHRDAIMGWLSGGERRNVMLSLVATRKDLPRVVAFDEPFAYLDAWGREFCKEIILNLIEDKRIVLLVDHENVFQQGREVTSLWGGSQSEE